MSTTAPPRPPRDGTSGPFRPNDPDALIEEARRRARRRRAAYGAVLILALLAIGLVSLLRSGGDRPAGPGGSAGRGQPASSGSSQSRAVARAQSRPVVVAAGLVAPRVGWAMNGLGLYWTDDGGAHWGIITPPDVASMGDAVARIGDIVYARPKHIWLVAEDIRGTESIAAAPRHSALERTTDGGRTWRSVRLPGCSDCAGVHLSVLRAAERGFALANSGRHSRLYATEDDAATWKRVADVPVAGPFAFSSRSNGWADGRGGKVLYRTVDGGRTWQRIKLEPPAAYSGESMTLGVPRAFGSRRGLVPARFRARGAKAQHVVVFVTEDGGESWVARPAPASANVGAQTWGFPEALPFSAPSPNDWVLFAGPALYVTRDAGRNWSVSHPRSVPRAPLVWDVGFVSPSSGWAVFGYRRSPRLVETKDGGRTWRPLSVVLR